MDRSRIKHTVILIIAIVVTGAFVTLFSVPVDPSAPPLGKLLFPGNGIWLVPTGYPGSEKHTIEGLDSDVTIYRDDWGVPHIYGKTMKDIAFGLGYAQAGDRLFFMDLARRFARGNLAEIIGPDALSVDRLSKTKLLEYHAEKMYNELKNSKQRKYQDYYESLESYVKGVNYYVETHPEDLPVEFRLLGYDFRPWTGLDSMAIAFYMLESGPFGYWDIDRFVVLSGFMKRFGRDRGRNLFVELFGNPAEGNVLPYQVPVNPRYGTYPDIDETGRKLANNTQPDPELSRVTAAFSSLLNHIKNVPIENQRIDLLSSSGSNSWAVHGSKTESGKPLACADSHEPWQLPNIYYEAHVVNILSGYNFYGYYVAGGAATPVDGHNQHLTWGMTVCHWDQIDWYYYDRAGDDGYIYNGKIMKFEDPITFTIKVKGQEPVKHTVRQTVHGPVFSDLVDKPPKAMRNMPPSLQDKVIAARWMSHHSERVKDLGICLMDMSRATNLDEFRAAMENFEAPPNHITYADAEGNIYVHSMGGFPLRDNTNLPGWHMGNGVFPYNGSRGEGDWLRIVRFDELPHTLNPPQGHVVGANQIVAGPEYFRKYTGQYRYTKGYRARRINELLSMDKKFTAEDMKQIHTDIVNLKARDFIPHLMRLLKSKKDLNERENRAFQILSEWQYDMDKDASAPSIYGAWVEYLYEGTFRDEWNAMGLTKRLEPEYPILEKLIRTKPDSIWFDNIETGDVRENAEDIIFSAFQKALESLEKFFNTSDMKSWKWGNIHQLEFVHMTGELDALNYGPVPYSGSYETITAPRNYLLQEGEFMPTNATRGAHHRLVVDFGDLTNCRTVLPGGNSGLSTTKSPINQFDLFINGKYHDEYFTADTPEKFLEQCKKVRSKIHLKKAGR